LVIEVVEPVKVAEEARARDSAFTEWQAIWINDGLRY
jgi:hypothetical protein